MGGKIYGTKKSKERREEPLGTMCYQTSSKRLPPFWLLIGARKTQIFWHQSEARTVATVWNWSGKTLSPGALLAVLYFSSCHLFFRPFRLFLIPTICPWVSEDDHKPVYRLAKFRHAQKVTFRVFGLKSDTAVLTFTFPFLSSALFSLFLLIFFLLLGI